MHISDPEHGLMLCTGIVGAGMPIAVGLGLSSQLKGDGKVTITNFGDGATNIGAFHESLNLASVWSLPVVFVCQNNQYGEHTRYSDTARNASVVDRAAAYAMKGIKVDGMDPVATYLAAKEAVDHARSGDGPGAARVRDVPHARPRAQRQERVHGPGRSSPSRSPTTRCPASGRG